MKAKVVRASRSHPASAPELPEATVSEHDGVRFLHLGTPWVQGAMRIRQPRRIELEYVQRMMAWLLCCDPATLADGLAVQLGLGAAAITRFTHQVLGMRTVAVELNPAVISACRSWFALPAEDARFEIVEGDALAWVGDTAHTQTVRVLCVDLYDHQAAAPVLDDDAFYSACHRVLADEDGGGGVMSVNLFGRNARFERSARRIAAAFGHRADAPRVWTLKPTREGNSIVLATKGLAMPPEPALSQRAELIAGRFGLPAPKWLRLIRAWPALR